MQGLTRRLCESEVSGVEGYKNARVRDLALDNSAEPLNATIGHAASLSLACSVEGHVTPKGGRISPTLRVPVVGVDGKPLMSTTSQRARRLLRNGLAEKHWNRLGQFYIQLLKPTNTATQTICLAVDPGSKWDGIALLSKKHVLTSGMLVLPSKVAKKLEQRRELRRARRYRKTLRRAKRFDNRRRPEGWIAPSQKAKVDFRIKVVDEQCKLYPITNFAVEDVRFNHYKKRGGRYFSTVEIGKAKFYDHLQKLGNLTLYTGVQTAEWRERLNLSKNGRKSSLTWDSHAVDAIAIGCAEIECCNPIPPEFWVWKRFEYARRQLHRLEPDKGGVRRRYGGSWSILPFRKGDVVQWHGKLARVGGFMDGRGLSLHSYGLKNRRLTQTAKPEECTRLFNQQVFIKHEPLQFLPRMNSGVSLEGSL